MVSLPYLLLLSSLTLLKLLMNVFFPYSTKQLIQQNVDWVIKYRYSSSYDSLLSDDSKLWPSPPKKVLTTQSGSYISCSGHSLLWLTTEMAQHAPCLFLPPPLPIAFLPRGQCPCRPRLVLAWEVPQMPSACCWVAGWLVWMSGFRDWGAKAAAAANQCGAYLSHRACRAGEAVFLSSHIVIASPASD